MKSELLQEIADSIIDYTHRVVIVSDPDRLLAINAVRSQLEKLTGYTVVEADGLELRVHYELRVRRNPETRIIYIRHTSTPVLSDISRNSKIAKISIANFFPNYTDKKLLSTLDFDILSTLYGKHIQGRVTSAKLQSLIDETMVASEAIEESPLDILRRHVESPDWSDSSFIQSLGKTIKALISSRKYDSEVAKLVDDLNFDFQHYLQDCYFPTLNSTGHPKAVHAVASYLKLHFDSDDKLALIVVDGMAWWQWEVLREELEKRKLIGIPEVKSIFSWLPSITALSRQAIFRGNIPRVDYRQTPAEEAKLWKQMWSANPLFNPVYLHDVKAPEDIITDTRRLAFVDVQLDKKMHQSSDYYDLFDLTRNWATKFASIIQRLKKEEFNIVLTTDHGNVLAEGTGTLKPEEKVHLYLANSRGERFVYFNSR